MALVYKSHNDHLFIVVENTTKSVYGVITDKQGKFIGIADNSNSYWTKYSEPIGEEELSLNEYAIQDEENGIDVGSVTYKGETYYFEYNAYGQYCNAYGQFWDWVSLEKLTKIAQAYKDLPNKNINPLNI